MGQRIRHRAGWKRTAVAVMLGYVLIIQALWSQAGLVRAAEFGFDPMTGLCSFDGPRHAPRDGDAPGPGAHGNLCCAAACAAFGGMPGLALLPSVAALPRPSAAGVASGAAAASPIPPARGWRPFAARAPPSVPNA